MSTPRRSARTRQSATIVALSKGTLAFRKTSMVNAWALSEGTLT